MFKTKSSSWHVINSDYPLKMNRKLLYLVFNLISNHTPIITRKFQLHFTGFDSDTPIHFPAQTRISPSRFACDNFWSSIDFVNLSEIIGKPLNILEVGCGTGIYSKCLSKLNKDARYLGIDISTSTNWTGYTDRRISFATDSYLSVDNYMEKANILITQSALEHFETDLELFEIINRNVQETLKPFIQIHVFPAGSSLKTNLWHGIRQYGLRAVNKIAVSASGQYKPLLFIVGGKKSNSLHFKRITLPQITHHYADMYSPTDVYLNELINSYQIDQKESNLRNASFYALVIQHNLGKQLKPSDIFTSK